MSGSGSKTGARTVREAFEEERGLLLPLPNEPFPALRARRGRDRQDAVRALRPQRLLRATRPSPAHARRLRRPPSTVRIVDGQRGGRDASHAPGIAASSSSTASTSSASPTRSGARASTAARPADARRAAARKSFLRDRRRARRQRGQHERPAARAARRRSARRARGGARRGAREATRVHVGAVRQMIDRRSAQRATCRHPSRSRSPRGRARLARRHAAHQLATYDSLKKEKTP
jgi:hypothetical protein